MAPTWRYAACIVLIALVAGPVGRGAEAATKKSDEERRAEYERCVRIVCMYNSTSQDGGGGK